MALEWCSQRQLPGNSDTLGAMITAGLETEINFSLAFFLASFFGLKTQTNHLGAKRLSWTVVHLRVVVDSLVGIQF